MVVVGIKGELEGRGLRIDLIKKLIYMYGIFKQ